MKRDYYHSIKLREILIDFIDKYVMNPNSKFNENIQGLP